MGSFEQLLENIKIGLSQPLPEFSAHKKLSSIHRLQTSIIPNDKTRESAVLVLLYQEKNTIYFPLIQRAMYDGTHGGQMAFPGGKKEDTDENLIRTALRESQEEIGIKAIDVKIIGELSTIFIPPSNFWVKPILGYLDYIPDFFPDSREVQKVVPIKLMDLLNDELLKEKEISINGKAINTPGFEFENNWVWGATALILSEFKEILIKNS
jgi:8-oxo-dGTP pyrophosphatase MutT (NUDIX family)